ncbi:MAG TPA: diaminopimelate epimerase [Bacillota bacterium]|nr:diaminopimelate epimerase [Bacillota bacterium]
MEFTKMHGLGNDFIIVPPEISANAVDWRALAVALCDRHLGIGADGLVLVLPSTCADLRMRIINSDGSEPQMCGNAIRCLAKYAFEHQIVSREVFSIETQAGIRYPELILTGNQVTGVKVNMGQPLLERSAIPMFGPKGQVINEPLSVGGQQYRVTSMLMNVPHTVIFVPDLSQINPAQLGPAIEKHPVYTGGTNVNFVEVSDAQTIKVRTWERGAGATLACGTGCCASVVAGALTGQTGRNVTVQIPVGSLLIEWAADEAVYMTGPAVTVFEGRMWGSRELSVES